MFPSTSYASKGHVQPFYGDIYSTTSLLQALQARSYKRELIIITGEPHHQHMFSAITMSVG